jgi:hypothetical protein
MKFLWLLPVAAVMVWLVWKFLSGLTAIAPRGTAADMEQEMSQSDGTGI